MPTPPTTAMSHDTAKSYDTRSAASFIGRCEDRTSGAVDIGFEAAADTLDLRGFGDGATVLINDPSPRAALTYWLAALDRRLTPLMVPPGPGADLCAPASGYEGSGPHGGGGGLVMSMGDADPSDICLHQFSRLTLAADRYARAVGLRPSDVLLVDRHPAHPETLLKQALAAYVTGARLTFVDQPDDIGGLSVLAADTGATVVSLDIDQVEGLVKTSLSPLPATVRMMQIDDHHPVGDMLGRLAAQLPDMEIYSGYGWLATGPVTVLPVHAVPRDRCCSVGRRLDGVSVLLDRPDSTGAGIALVKSASVLESWVPSGSRRARVGPSTVGTGERFRIDDDYLYPLPASMPAANAGPVVERLPLATLVPTSESRQVAYLGPSGSFTELALMTQADLSAEALLPRARIVDVLNTVAAGDADCGFVAIENAIEGTVNVTLDTLAFDHQLLIQREVVLDIHLDLMAAPGTDLASVTEIRSHPVANAQCRRFLDRELPGVPVLAANSTSEAAAQAAGGSGLAALAPAAAAGHYGLQLLSTDVADHPGNQTRFVLVAPGGIPAPTGHDKTTVVLTRRGTEPGSLVVILEEFAAREINLSRISSRPVKTSLGSYCFIVDLEGHIADELVADCLRSIRAKHVDVKFLGSYPAAAADISIRHTAAASARAEADHWMNGLRAQIAAA